ncbi:MAG: DUF1186 domain-containing protein [Nitrospirales bacterium]|nr:DUF1186 domain-containing protein [Nitrospirales bacterium]
MDERIQRILDELDHYDGTYKREAMEEAVALRNEITPYLIAHLEELLADPVRYFEEGHYANMYVFTLLGYFREAGAHEVIMKIAALPEGILDDLFNDMITEDFSWIMYATSGGSVELLKELVLDRGAYVYSRGAAAHAIVYAVVDGAITREAAIGFFTSLFTGNEAEEDSDFWSSIASNISDLYPEEAMDTIRKGFENRLIDKSYIDYEWFEGMLHQGKEQVLERTRQEMRAKLDREDIHSYMSWWASFNEGPPSEIPEYRADDSRKKAVKIKKKKRKIAKASRKKNRR